MIKYIHCTVMKVMLMLMKVLRVKGETRSSCDGTASCDGTEEWGGLL